MGVKKGLGKGKLLLGRSLLLNIEIDYALVMNTFIFHANTEYQNVEEHKAFFYF